MNNKRWFQTRAFKIIATLIILAGNICWYLPIGGIESGAQSAADVHPLLCVFLSDVFLAALGGYVYFSVSNT